MSADEGHVLEQPVSVKTVQSPEDTINTAMFPCSLNDSGDAWMQAARQHILSFPTAKEQRLLVDWRAMQASSAVHAIGNTAGLFNDYSFLCMRWW